MHPEVYGANLSRLKKKDPGRVLHKSVWLRSSHDYVRVRNNTCFICDIIVIVCIKTNNLHDITLLLRGADRSLGALNKFKRHRDPTMSSMNY